MNYEAKWTGNGYGLPQRWARKGEIPSQNPGVVAMRLAFRFEVAWIVRDHEGAVLMPNGGWMPTWDFRLHEFGRVIGPCDFASADVEKWNEAWRACAFERRNHVTT